MRIIVNAEVLLKGWERNYRTTLIQVTHEKCKGVGEFAKQFFDGHEYAENTAKNKECKCEHICLAALKFCMRKEFVQVELG